jgi:hypothetical protein
MKRCYAEKIGGCSNKMSNEHFLSDGIQDLLSDSDYMMVSGYTWCEPGEQKRLPKGTQKSRILCEKHNRELGVLDASATKLFKFLKGIQDLEKGKIEQAEFERKAVIKGDLFERWCLKYVTGALVSGNAKAGKFPINADFVSERIAKVLFGLESWPSNWGLYVDASKQPNIAHRGVEGSTGVDERNDKFIVIQIKFHGLFFVLSFLDFSKPLNELTKNDLVHDLRYRPSRLNIVRKGKIYEVLFTWSNSFGTTEEVNLIAG